jgi:hypothetical protein
VHDDLFVSVSARVVESALCWSMHLSGSAKRGGEDEAARRLRSTDGAEIYAAAGFRAGVLGGDGRRSWMESSDLLPSQAWLVIPSHFAGLSSFLSTCSCALSFTYYPPPPLFIPLFTSSPSLSFCHLDLLRDRGLGAQ